MMECMVRVKDLHDAVATAARWTSGVDRLDHIWVFPTEDPTSIRIFGSDNLRLVAVDIDVTDRTDGALGFGIHRDDVLTIIPYLQRYAFKGDTYIGMVVTSERWSLSGAMGRVDGLVNVKPPDFNAAVRDPASTDARININPRLFGDEFGEMFGDRLEQLNVQMFVGGPEESIVFITEGVRAWVMPMRPLE